MAAAEFPNSPNMEKVKEEISKLYVSGLWQFSCPFSSPVSDRSTEQTFVHHGETHALSDQPLGEGLPQEKEQMVRTSRIIQKDDYLVARSLAGSLVLPTSIG